MLRYRHLTAPWHTHWKRQPGRRNDILYLRLSQYEKGPYVEPHYGLHYGMCYVRSLPLSPSHVLVSFAFLKLCNAPFCFLIIFPWTSRFSLRCAASFHFVWTIFVCRSFHSPYFRKQADDVDGADCLIFWINSSPCSHWPLVWLISFCWTSFAQLFYTSHVLS